MIGRPRYPLSTIKDAMPSKIPRGPAVVVGVTTIATVGAIVYSHYSQVRDQKVMREGVKRDKERLRLKRKLKREAEQQKQS